MPRLQVRVLPESPLNKGLYTLIAIEIAVLSTAPCLMKHQNFFKAIVYYTWLACIAIPLLSSCSSAQPMLSVDAGARQHPISPYIYGMNFASETLATDLRLPLNRWGGNAVTRYNWQNDTSNRASDWFFKNIPYDNTNPDALPGGSASDRFVAQNQATGTQTLLTIPLIGWTPKNRGFDCGFRVSKYGPQAQVDPAEPDCGNGFQPDGVTPIVGNDPFDTSVPIDEIFVQNWINHLVGQYGTADAGGVAFYNLDNEPMLWNQTHRDIHPDATSYDEVRDRAYQYAAAVKAIDPGAQILGPTEWGWTAYFYSALDIERGDWQANPQDRNAHGGVAFVEWYLQQMQIYEQENGVRILDFLDLHYYPQSGIAFQPAGNAITQTLRLRSTRSLWDSTYTDESWIDEPVYLIPRMRDWIDNNYPGTKLAVSEYNWGALDHINGALAQADVLGLFGRERVDLAALWAELNFDDPAAFAFRMYRNYDGNGSSFGDVSLSATSTDQEQLAIYAAQRSHDNALTLIVINKSENDLTGNVSLSGFTPSGNAAVYRYSEADLSTIVRQPDQAVTARGFGADFPASSITLFVLTP